MSMGIIKMTWKVIILLVFASLASCESNGIALQARADTCKRIGPQCSADRKEVLLCTEVGKPGKVMKNCEAEGRKRCSEESGSVKCVEAKPDDDKPVKYLCSAAGEYPDPLDCKFTYKCSAGKDYPTERCHCEQNGFVYPDTNADHPCFELDECPRDEIQCEEGKKGEFTVNGERTGVCYFCTGKDTSTAFKCGNETSRVRGGPVDKICVRLEEPPKTEPTQQPPTKPTKAPEQKPKCKKPGELHKTECDCDFYECDENLVPQRRICRKGMLWDSIFKKCIYGDCTESECIYRKNNKNS